MQRSDVGIGVYEPQLERRLEQLLELLSSAGIEGPAGGVTGSRSYRKPASRPLMPIEQASALVFA